MNLLFLNSLGTGEVVLIFFVVLILFGSKGIPDFAKNLGRGMREIKTASDEIKKDLQNSALEMRKDLKLENPLNDIPKLDDILKEDPPKNQPLPPISGDEENNTEDKA